MQIERAELVATPLTLM